MPRLHMNRRDLLTSAAVLPLALALGACAPATTTTPPGTGTTPPTIPTDPLATVIQFGQTVAAGFNSIVSLVEAIPSVDPTVVQNILAIVNKGAQALPTILNIASAANPVQAIFSSLPSLTSLLAGIPGIPADVQTWINAAASLAQVVGPLVGIALSIAAAPAPGRPAPAPVTATLDPTTAYLQLRALAVRRPSHA